MPLTANEMSDTSTFTFAGYVMNQMSMLCVGDGKTSSTNRTVTTAPETRALTGVLKRSCTFDSHLDPGSAPSRANENAKRLPAPWIDVPHEKNAKMIRQSR